MEMRADARLKDPGNGETMALIEEIGRVRSAEIELIVEIHAARGDVL